jgi:hypothetical protein
MDTLRNRPHQATRTTMTKSHQLVLTFNLAFQSNGLGSPFPVSCIVTTYLQAFAQSFCHRHIQVMQAQQAVRPIALAVFLH